MSEAPKFDSAYDLMRAALNEAEHVVNAADKAANDIAKILAKGQRIRWVYDQNALRRLKRALRDFDMRTGTWQ